MKPLRIGYFCIIPTLWLKKPVITGYFASIILIKQYLSTGAVIASIVAECCVTTMELQTIKKIFDIKYILFSMLKYSMPTIIMAGTIIGLQHILSSGVLGLIIQVLTAIIVYFSVLIVMKDQLTTNAFKKLWAYMCTITTANKNNTRK